MHTGQASKRWQRASGWLIIFLIAACAAAAIISILPGGTAARTLGSAPRRARVQPASHLDTTPVSATPTISPTPGEGPVGTLVSLQGTGWTAGSQVLISYDSDTTCAGPNLTELSPDPKPTASSSGTFSVSFHWPKVTATETWSICAATSDGAATASAAFNVLSLSAPALSILTKGPLMPGQTMTVQGKNWFPGGWRISFALQRVHSATSLPLEESAISLFNGTFPSTTITIPTYVPPGSYVLVATMEQQALEAQSGAITIAATPTPTPTATPSPSPTPIIIVTPTPTLHRQSSPSPPRLSSTLLALVIISGGMALAFALIGTALLIYLLRSRPNPAAALTLDETGPLKPKASG